MKNLLFRLLLVPLLYCGCSSLKKTDADLFFSIQGSYFCKPVILYLPHDQETNASKDVTRMRCYRDQWLIKNHHVIYDRILYQQKSCDAEIGKFHAEVSFNIPDENAQSALEINQVKCTFLKTEPN